MTPLEWTSEAVEQTQAFGEQLGRALRPGDVVALYGVLGSGKTTLIQGIARGMGLEAERVKSPTFVLMREYPGAVPLVHMDGYRLEGAPAVAWLDLEQLFSPRTVSVIEWAERCEGLLPDDHLEIRLAHLSANRRRFTVHPHGARAAAVAAQLQTDAPPAAASASSDEAAEPPQGDGPS